ncbi:MAG TPA: aspartate kinase [Flavobacterium sp.]|nr:aspartate kinase [Flavobacterium sp.]
MKVLKFGGTSVGSAARMKAVADLINTGESNIVVLSAMSGTTNALVEISEAFKSGDDKLALKLTNTLEEKYIGVAGEFYDSAKSKASALSFIKQIFDGLKENKSTDFGSRDEKTILAQGELISTGLFQLYLEEAGVKSILLPALDFMKIDKDEEPDKRYISRNLKKLLQLNPSYDIYLTQGYICRNIHGEIDNLKRGGSDYSASLIGAAINAEEIQIWTDIDGMHNNDPRIVPNTYPIARLSFDEAAELAYFGAKILHPASVRPAKDKNIPVRLLNTMAPDKEGTVIEAESEEGGIKAVAAKDGITAIKIKSGRMLLAFGFLKKVFDIFEKYRTPIDMITTSEVAVSLTIDNTSHLDEITKKLERLGQVSVDSNQTIICVVGDFIADKPGFILQIFEVLKNIPIRMVSYGGSKHNVSLLINTDFKKEALLALNEGLFAVQHA